jgi:hypothetical protein
MLQTDMARLPSTFFGLLVPKAGKLCYNCRPTATMVRKLNTEKIKYIRVSSPKPEAEQ